MSRCISHSKRTVRSAIGSTSGSSRKRAISLIAQLTKQIEELLRGAPRKTPYTRHKRSARPLPTEVKRVANHVMPAVKKVAKVAPMLALEIAQAAKTDEKTVAASCGKSLPGWRTRSRTEPRLPQAAHTKEPRRSTVPPPTRPRASPAKSSVRTTTGEPISKAANRANPEPVHGRIHPNRNRHGARPPQPDETNSQPDGAS